MGTNPDHAFLKGPDPVHLTPNPKRCQSFLTSGCTLYSVHSTLCSVDCVQPSDVN